MSYLQLGKCYIDDACYNDGDMKVNDTHFDCVSNINNLEWSVVGSKHDCL